MSILNIKEMFRAKAGRFIALFSLFFLTAAAALAQTPVWSVAPTVTNVNGGLNITLNYAVDNFGTAGKVYVAILPGNFPANQWNSNQIKNRINAGTYEGVVLDVTDNGAQSHVITLGNFIASQEYTVFFVAEGESGNNHAYNPEAAYFTTNTCPQPDVWYNFNQGGKCVNVGATAYFSAQAQTGQLRTDPNYTGIYEGTVWEMDWGDGTKTTFTSSVDNEVPPPPDEGSPWLHTYAYLEGLCAVEARITITNRCGMSFTTFINVELHGPEDLDYGDGDVVIAPAAPWEVNDAGVIEVCEGKESVVTLLDNSIWNCLAPVLGKPNSSRRDIQWFYGVEPARGAWNATGAIQNTIHGAVAVGSLGNATATAGRYGQRINGIQSAGTASDAITIPETAEAGDYFWVYLKYWNDCNRADDKYVSERIQILVVDAPAAPTVSSRTICLEDITTPPASPDARTLTVTSAPAGTLTWYSDANLTASSVVATGTAYTPNVTAPGTYTYYVTDQSVDGLKCISEATKVTLTVRETLPRPGIITANPAYICNGANATFSVAAAPADMPFGGPTQYRWEVPAGWKINSGQGTRSINVTAGTVDGEHTVKVFREYTTAPNCPSQERTVTVTVYPFPTVNSPATDLACSGKLFIYNATGEKQGQGRTLPAGTYRYNFKWSRSVVTGINNGLGAGQSGSIQETLNNITTQPVTVIYQITPTIVRPDGLAACEGDPFTLRVTVAPNADIKAKDAEICSGETASKTPVHSDADRVPPNTTYSWVPKADVTGVSDFEAGNSGAGNSISVAPKNNTSEVKEVIYTVTPTTKTTTALGTIECEGTSFDFTVKINPTPSIQRIDKTICSGETFTVVPVDGTDGIVPSNTTYTWTLYSSSQWSNVDGESPQNNPVTSISNTLTNRTNANVTVRYVVTPKSGDCSGTPFHIWVVVNPKPDIGNFERETCSGVAFTAVKPVNGTDGIVPTSTRYTWSEPVLENSGALTGGQAGTGNNLTQITGTLTNTTNIPQKATYKVTPRSGNCTGETFDIVVIVNPKPFVKAEPIDVCSGKEFKLEPSNGGTNNNIVPANTTYTWSAPRVPAGDVLEGGASGSNAATITGTLTNNTNTVQTATYTVTPKAPASVGGCSGDPFTVTVNVHPTPDIDDISDEICNGDDFSLTPVNGTNGIVPANTSYTWTVFSNPGDAIGGVVSNSIPSSTINGDNLTNSTNLPLAVIYEVTPVTDRPCPGETFKVTVTVNPTPTISSVSTKTVCSNEPLNYSITSSTTGATFVWSRAEAIGITETAATDETANPINESLTNTTNQDIQVTYTITPSYKGCQGTPFNLTVTVHPQFRAAQLFDDISICNNTSTMLKIVMDGGVAPYTVNYTRSFNGGNAVAQPELTNYTSGAEFTTGNLLSGEYEYEITSVTDANGCPVQSNGNTVTVTVGEELEDATITGSADACYDENNESYLNVHIVGGTPKYTLKIIGGGQTITVTGYVSGNNISLGVLPAGTHTYKLEFVQDACYSPGNSSGFITFANATHTIKIYPVPDISKTPVPQAICSDETASIEINSDVAYSTFDLEIFSTSPETNDAGYEWVGGKNPLPVTVTDIDPDGIYTVTTQLKHNHNAPVAVTYRITPTSPDQCVGEYIDRTVVVNPVPVVGNETDEICSGGTFTVVPDPDDEDNVIPAGTTYTWSAPSVTSDAEGGTITGGVAGSGSSITGTLTNTSTSIQTATYTVIPKWGDCEVGKFTVIVTVNPTPVLSSPEESSACSGVLFDSYTAASATPGTTFTWSRAKVTNITPETGSGTDANIEETLVNATADPIEVEYVFTLTANGCTNEQKVKVMVNPKPTLLSTTTTPICSGEKFEFTANSATAGVTYSWKRLDNLNISGTPTSESNGTISEPLTNTSTSPVDVKYEITLTANGCSNKQEVTVTVNPTPVLSSEKFPSICSGTLGATTPSFVYDATSETAGTTFTWSRAFEAGISPITNGSGLNGEIKENLINNTAEPIDVKYVFTLTANGCTNTQTVTVKVYPRPTLLENTGTPICSGAEFNFTAESETAGVTYSWERLDNLNIKEAPTTGTGASIKDEVLTNTSRNNVTVTYKFTLTANGCSNTSDVTVTVYPTPTLYSNLNPPTAFCSGSTIEYNAVSLTQGTVTYSWKRLTGLERGIDGGASSGTGTGAKIEEKLTNTTSSTVDVKYEMTLTLTNTIDDVEYKCTNQQTVTIKVSPQPAIGNMAASICNNGTFTVIPKDNDDDGEGDGIVPSNTTYTWGVPVVTGGVKGGAAGTGSFTSGITGTLINPTTEEQTATYTVTPTSGDCPGSPFEVVVTVMPDVKIISDDEGETCNNELYIYTAESSTTHDVTFAWKRAKVTGITNDAASDNSATIEEKLYNDGVNPVYVEYKITPYYKGCPGTEFTHTVTVYPTPTLSSSRSSTICSSSSANFIYTPASLTDNVSFSWERLPAPGLTTTELEQGDGNISHVLRNFTSAQITVTYRYTLTIDGTDGCKNEQDVEVKINPEPVITKDQEVQACSDAAINYQIELDNFENPDDGVTFTWSAPVLSPVSTDFTGGSARSTASAANITDSFHNATGGIGTATYTVTPYKDGCPGEAVTIVVTVGAEPVLADLDKTVCSDEAIALTLGVAAGSIDAAYYNIIEVKPTFGLTADGGNASWPNGNVEADYLEDDKYTNNTNGSLTVTYRVQPMINGTCYGDEKDIVITVLPALKSGSITPPTPLTICAGEDVAEIVGTSATGGNGDYTYTWYYTTNLSAAAGDASWVEITGANEASYNPGILTVSTNYIRKVSDSKCEVVRYSNIVKITVNPLPVTSTIAGPELLCDDAIDVIYRVEDHPNTVYEWTVTDANGIFSFVFKEGKNFMIVNAVPGASGTATIKVREQNTKTGCWSEPVEKRVTVSPVLPGDDIIGPDEVCEGATNVRYAVANKDGSENSVYKWTAPGAYIIGDDDKHEIFVTFGSISGVVISVVETPLGGGCPTTHNSKTVTVNPSPRVFNVTAPVAYCADDNGVTITLSGSETGTTYQLFKNGVEDGDPVDGTTGSSLTWDDRTAGEYTVVATRNGCEKEMNGTVTPAVNTVDPGSIGGNQTVCLNGVPSAFTSDEDAEDTSDGTIIYQWEISTDGGSSFSEIRGANLADYTHMSRLTDDVKFRRWASSTVYSASGTSNPCREVSNVIDVKVDNFNPGTIKEDGQIICSGAIPGKFTSDIAPVADEGELSYQWMYSTDGLIYNNVADGTDEEYASGALTADTWFKRMVISTLSDGSFCTKETNPVYVQVISVVPGIVGSAQDICYGTVPAMLTGRSAGGDAPFNYQWEQSTDESLWTAIEDETGLTYQPEALTQDTWYRIRVISQQDKDESCPQYTTSVKITVVNLNAGKIGEDQIVCENGTPDALNVITPASGDDDDGNFGYQWQYSTDNIYFYNVPLATAQTYTPGALTEDTWYRLQVTSIVGTAQCPAYTDTVWIHVNNVNPGEIGEDQFICENGTPLEITSIAAAVVDGDPSYKWEWSPDNTPGSVWTEIEDETGPAYQPAALTQDTYFRRVAVSTAADGTECEMATEPVKITVVNIDPGTIGRNQDICLGDVAQPIRGLTAPLVDGGEPVFSWFKSEDSGASWDVINGATGANYTPLNVTKDTWYKRRVTSSLPGNCFKDNDPVIIRVIEFNAGSLGSDRIVCEGEAPEAFDITAPSGNHTYTYTYQWLYSHDDSWYREIATTEEYTPGALTQDTWYVRKVTATLNDTKFCDKADKVYVQVVNFDPGTIYPEKQVICYGDTPTPITGSEASGDGDFNYQWEYRTATSAWTPISGATDWASYIPDPDMLTEDIWYRRIATSELKESCTLSSNEVRIIINKVDGGTIGSDGAVCYGAAPEEFTSETDGSGSGTAISYRWYKSTNGTDFTPIYSGDATSATYTSDEPLYADTWFIRQTISVLDNKTCTANSNEIKITVNPLPVGTISGGTTICPGDEATITVEISAGTAPFEVVIANLGTRTLTAGTNTFKVSPAAGTVTEYRITSITDANNCVAADITGSAIIIVRKELSIDTQPEAVEICESEPAIFSVSATDADSYQWFVKTPETGIFVAVPGETNSELRLNVTRDMDGYEYHVVVTGCGDTETSNDVTLTVNTAPSVTQPQNSQVCEDNEAEFTVTAAGTGSFTYQWQVNTGSGFTDIADNEPFSGAETATLTISKTPLAYNNYQFQVIVSGECGTVTSQRARLTVNKKPEITLQPEDAGICANGGPVTFEGTASGVTSYKWQERVPGGNWTDINDGGMYSGTATPWLTLNNIPLSANGNKYQLVFIASCGNITSKEVLLTVHENPVVNLSPTLDVCATEPTELDGNPTGGSGNYISHVWSGSGAWLLNDRSVQKPVFTSVAAGTFTLTYIVTDSEGCTASASIEITVEKPDATFTHIVRDGCTPLEVKFVRNMTGVDEFEWDYGDGTPVNTTEASPEHTFINTGTSIIDRTVTLKVKSAAGCIATYTSTVRVYPAFSAAFTMSTDTVCSGDAVAFTAIQGARQYYWDFGDGEGGISPAELESHIYNNPGQTPRKLTVELTTTSIYGCTSTTFMELVVMPKPDAEFEANPPSQIYSPQGNTVAFTDRTNPGNWTYLWDFGDGTTSAEQHPEHLYTTSGEFEVTLTVSNESCSDAVTHTVKIAPPAPVASFDPVPSGCAPLVVTLNNTSLNTDVPGTTYLWNFGDGSASTARNPNYTYLDAGIYKLELTVTGPGGTSTASQIVHVYASPKAYFEVTPEYVFANDERVRMFNLTTGADTYLWEFGDGDTSTVKEPYHRYMESGEYDITLWAYSANGCSDMYVMSPGVTVEPAGDLKFATVFRPNLSGPIERTDLPTGGSETDQFFYPSIRDKVIDFKMQVYSRLGVLIFETSDINVPWNGYYNGQLCAQGVYVWLVEGKYANGQPFRKTGDITLLH